MWPLNMTAISPRRTARYWIPEMAEMHVDIFVVNPRTAARSEEIAALADTGATLTVIPGEILRRLGIQKVRTVSLMLADGHRAQRDVGDAAVSVNGESVPCRVVFGESGDAVLLGPHRA